MSRHAARTGAAVGATRSVASLRARSETRVATLSPKSSASPSPSATRCRSAVTTCRVGRPRREADRSMTSSWMRAKRWSSSRAAATRTRSAWRPGRAAGDGPAPVGQHRPQPLAVVACPLGQLADEVDPQGAGVGASRVVGRVVGGGGHQRVGRARGRCGRARRPPRQRAADRGREALGAEVERGHVGTHRLNRPIPSPVGLDSTRSCGAPEPRQVEDRPPHNLRQSLSRRRRQRRTSGVGSPSWTTTWSSSAPGWPAWGAPSGWPRRGARSPCSRPATRSAVASARMPSTASSPTAASRCSTPPTRPCGAGYRDTASIQGALVSGDRVATAVLAALAGGSPPHSTGRPGRWPRGRDRSAGDL